MNGKKSSTTARSPTICTNYNRILPLGKGKADLDHSMRSLNYEPLLAERDHRMRRFRMWFARRELTEMQLKLCEHDEQTMTFRRRTCLLSPIEHELTLPSAVRLALLTE